MEQGQQDIHMKEVFTVISDLLNNWDNPQTIAGAVVVAVVGIVIRYFEKKKLVKKLKEKKD